MIDLLDLRFRRLLARAGADLAAFRSRAVPADSTVLARHHKLYRDSHRLEAILGNLCQGVASADDSADRVILNSAAARSLNLTAGEITTAEFSTALTALAKRALNSADIVATVQEQGTDRSADIDATWHFANPPPTCG